MDPKAKLSGKPEGQKLDVNAKPAAGGNEMIKQQQREVQEVTDIMRKNVELIQTREHKLDELDKRADELVEKSALFQKATKKLEKKYWWENHKMKIIIGAIGGGILILTIAGSLIFFL